MNNKPTLCVDFDGVIHSYTSGWKGAAEIPDPPVPGALEWLWRATETFDVKVYSSRSRDPEAIIAMRSWMRVQSAHIWEHEHPMCFGCAPDDYPIDFVHEKPAAFLTIDDRAICFDGDWSKLNPAELRKFKPWNVK
jgi:hypothetical protein